MVARSLRILKHDYIDACEESKFAPVQRTNGIHDLKSEELPISSCVDVYGVSVKVIVPQFGVDI